MVLRSRLREPDNSGGNVAVEHAIVALTEREPRQIRQTRIRDDDRTAQANVVEPFIELPLRQRDIDRGRLHLESIVEHTMYRRVPSVTRNLQHAILTFP